MREMEKNKLNRVLILHIFLISTYSYLENHFPSECFLNIMVRNFYKYFKSMKIKHTFTEWDQPNYNFKELSLLQLNVSMQNCDERRNDLCILLASALKI